MVPEQFVPIDVSGVHADNRMVHQQVDVEIGDADRLRNRAVGLPKVFPPFREGRPTLLVLDQMSAFAVSGKKPLLPLHGMKNATQPQNSHEAPDHRARERDVEGPDFASLWFRDVEDARSEIDMFDPRALQGVRPASREQQEPMEFAANGVVERPELADPRR